MRRVPCEVPYYIYPLWGGVRALVAEFPIYMVRLGPSHHVSVHSLAFRIWEYTHGSERQRAKRYSRWPTTVLEISETFHPDMK